MVKPIDCGECKDLFFQRAMLQLEARHTAALYGPKAAEALVNEALEEEHTYHDS